MEPTERQHVLDGLAASRAKMLEAVKGFTGEQWHFRPAESHWSAADCLEHIVLSENRVLGRIEQILQEPPDIERAAEIGKKDSLVARAIPNRSRRVQAPEPSVPRRTWPDPGELMDQFEQTRARTIRFASETQCQLRHHFFPHFALQDLDCYQWLLMLGFHCDRHAQQVEELKTDPAFRPVLADLREVVRRIPKGKVSTYGAVARAAGYPGRARQVVWALHNAKGLPWHRVVGAGGRILLPGDSGLEQRIRLETEGVSFSGSRVRMGLHEHVFRARRART